MFSLPVDVRLDEGLSPAARTMFRDRYQQPGEVSPQQALARAAAAYADDPAHAERLYRYASRQWFMWVSPMLINAARRRHFAPRWEDNFTAECFDGFHGTPISCFLNVAGNGIEQQAFHAMETAWISRLGGGVGGSWAATGADPMVPERGAADTLLPHLKVIDSVIMAYPEGGDRKAAYAAYLDIGHPAIVEFLELRKPTGGDIHRKCLNLNHGVNIPDAFMQLLERCIGNPQADDRWPLVDPVSQQVVAHASARALWQRLIEMRRVTGEPFICFTDTANRAMPVVQRLAGLRITQSNLCNEVLLPTSVDRTAVCCLSSVNLARFDEWRDDEQFIPDLVRMLDNGVQVFIDNAPPVLNRAVYAARRERAIGLGAMGFHTYLQDHGLAFDDEGAAAINTQMFALLHRRAQAATAQLAAERGACPDANGLQRRNMYLMAVAPNASSSELCGGVSPGIEPVRANVFVKKTLSGSMTMKNPALARHLQRLGLDNPATWADIAAHGGSVQHLDALPDDLKRVFQTAMEVDPMRLVVLAAQRQPFICQGQSLNLFFPVDASVRTVHDVHFAAWKLGVKTLYYMRSEAVRRAEALSVPVALPVEHRDPRPDAPELPLAA